MSNLIEHAKSELEKAGLFDKDADYEGVIGKNALEIITVFSKQGHSGGSAGMIFGILERLMQYKNLTPITSDPEEWADRSIESGRPMWQNKRNYSIFSEDGGQNWYDIEKRDAEKSKIILP